MARFSRQKYAGMTLGNSWDEAFCALKKKTAAFLRFVYCIYDN